MLKILKNFEHLFFHPVPFKHFALGGLDEKINGLPHLRKAIVQLAESERFELSIPCDIHAFQACSLSHSENSPVALNSLVFDFKNYSGSGLGMQRYLFKSDYKI